MTENLTNVAWKCRECGEITLHPSIEKLNDSTEIRETTLCRKCSRENPQIQELEVRNAEALLEAKN